MSDKSTEKVNVEELLAKANKPKQISPKYHIFYGGKIETSLKVPVRSLNDFSIWYTPGVAEASMQIKRNKDLVFDMTNKRNTIAIISDGTRVLGLGNIGPEAGLPVMEGKAMIFKYLGGVDVFPLCLNTSDPDEIIKVSKLLEPSIGGINLEDIEKPKCYYILDRLKEESNIPVWHDDQQGTALVTVAGLISALKVVGKKMSDVKIAVVGAGAAMTNTIKYLEMAGASIGNFVVADSKGILHQGRTEIEDKDNQKWKLCLRTNKHGLTGDISAAFKGADVCLAAARPGPGIIKKEWVSTMADDSIVFAMANPVPEIWPWEAKKGGARIIATGRSDFPNQVNNSIGFPAVFRGVLDSTAKKITDEMCLAAAFAISEYAEEKGLHEEYIIPTMSERGVFIKEAVAVGIKALEQGVTRLKVSRQELEERAEFYIKRSQDAVNLLMKQGIIKSVPF